MIVLFVPWPKTDEHVALRTLRPFALSPSFPSDQVGEFLPLEYGARQGQPAAHAARSRRIAGHHTWAAWCIHEAG